MSLLGDEPAETLLHEIYQGGALQQHRRDDERFGADVDAQLYALFPQPHVNKGRHLTGHRHEWQSRHQFHIDCLRISFSVSAVVEAADVCQHGIVAVIINTVEGFQKLRNVQRDPRVAVALSDPNNLIRYITVRGRVVATTTDGGTEHIESRAQKYLGGPYPWYGGRDQVRTIVTIAVEKFNALGG